MTADTTIPTETRVPVVEARPGVRNLAIGMAIAALACLLLGLGAGGSGRSSLRLDSANDFFALPVLTAPTTATSIALGVLVLLAAAYVVARRPIGRTRTLLTWWAVLAVIISFLLWAGSGDPNSQLDAIGLLQATVFLAVPLVLGAMAGTVSERSGIINVAIEGQMLAAAFLAALVGTVAHNLVAGTVAGVVAGVLVGALLGSFAIRYQVNQVVLGVVINLLVLGLTTYLYSRLLQQDSAGLNQPGTFKPIAIPVLSRIPLIGPVLFEANVLVYLAAVVVAVLNVMLWRSRWGLRTRAVGEHPRAADTLGINVNRLRFRNSLLAGGIAGLAGAYISIGSVGGFGINMTSGRGFIALAAVIFGRWTPLGSMGAAILFAFSSALNTALSFIGTPIDIPSQILGSLPYLVTLLVVAGVVGRTQAPANDGVPYSGR
ncbi:MAG: ABC transporter permease [Lapillicoccus sp.]